MIKSMTGYASESFVINTTKFLVEIKSVNSKNIDLSIRIPQFLKSFENDLRKELSVKLHRGKIELNVSTEGKLNKEDVIINKEVIEGYIIQLQELNLNHSIGILDGEPSDYQYLKIAMNLPNAYTSKSIELNNTQSKSLLNKIYSLISKVDTYRKKEGLETEKDIKDKISRIKKSLNQIKKIEKERISKKRKKLFSELDKIKLEIDNNRFEQEMIYYLEKYDINEEIVRLKSNILMFEDTLDSNEPVGKKLGFICQEIGREINTIGSKANASNLQKHVIEMKENLEKIKENILNIL